MWSVAPVAGAYDAAAYIHPSDRHLLTDPMRRHLARDVPAMLLGGDDDVRRARRRAPSSPTGARSTLAGLEFAVDHTPGHTAGSVTFRAPYDGPEDVPEVMFSGDLLFAGSIGRTDLPGGDHPTMLRSLADKVLPLDDASSCCPGTGRRPRSAASAPPTPSSTT